MDKNTLLGILSCGAVLTLGISVWIYRVHTSLKQEKNPQISIVKSDPSISPVQRIYDTKGRIIKTIYDFNRDGNPEQITHWEYDSLDRIVKKSIDKQADGSIDEVWQHNYDNSGNLKSKKRIDIK